MRNQTYLVSIVSLTTIGAFACGGTSAEPELALACGAENDELLDGTVDLVWSFTYDVNGNSLRDEADDGVDGTIDDVWEYQHDADSNMTLLQEDAANDGTIDYRASYTYDGAGNQLTELEDFDGVGPSTETLRVSTYDDDDNLLTVTVDDDNDGSVDQRTEFSYENGRVSLVEIFDGEDNMLQYSTRAYDNDGGLVRIERFSGESPFTLLQVEHIQEDVHGNIVLREVDAGNDGVINDRRIRTYNADDKLIYREDDYDADGEAEFIIRFDYNEEGLLLAWEFDGTLLTRVRSTQLYDCSQANIGGANRTPGRIETQAAARMRTTAAQQTAHQANRQLKLDQRLSR